MNTFIPANSGKRQITRVAMNRTVHSCWTEHRDLRVLFTDNTELIVTWGDNHAELRGTRTHGDLPAVPIAEGPVSRILVGKVIQYCFLNHEAELVIRTRCGHEAVIGYDNAPVIRKMDVRFELPAPPEMSALLGWPQR